jgi:lipopolysaccharide biosynthesis regulator YciM
MDNDLMVALLNNMAVCLEHLCLHKKNPALRNKAIATLEKALELCRGDYTVNRNLGVLLKKNGEEDRSRKIYRRLKVIAEKEEEKRDLVRLEEFFKEK